jgi:hypothetical protein
LKEASTLHFMRSALERVTPRFAFLESTVLATNVKHSSSAAFSTVQSAQFVVETKSQKEVDTLPAFHIASTLPSRDSPQREKSHFNHEKEIHFKIRLL